MPVPYYGDFAEDDTVKIPFNTFTSDDPSASVTITNLADADIKVHKDGGDTEIATDGASVLINFDSRTGAHLITIDTSAHSDYSTGSEYAVLVEGTTVDGGTINAWIGAFSIERAGGAIALLKAMLDVNNRVDVGSWLGQAVTLSTGNKPDVNIDEINDDTTAVFTLRDWLGKGIRLTADSGTTTTLVDAGLTQADDYWNGALLIFRTGTNIGRTAIITDFDAGTDTLTFAPAMPDAVTSEGFALIPGLGWSDVQAIAAVQTVVDAIQAVTDAESGVKAAVNALNDLSAADVMDTVDALLGGLNDLSAANVNAEVVDVLKTDTKGEPAQGAPGVNISIEAKIAWLYKFMRNKITNDGTDIKVYNDAETVVDHKAPVAEAAGTVTRGEFVTGP